MSLLTIVQEAAGSINQPVPTVVFGSTAGDAVLWRNLAQREGRELARRHDWQGLIGGISTPTPGTAVQTALPSDFDRFSAGGHVWNSTLKQKYLGPADESTWLQVSILGLPVFPGYWRLVGGNLFILPAPAAGQTLTINYLSKNWALSNLGVAKAAFTDDADTAIVPEHLIALGITWRWLRAKGMDYAEEMSTYEREVEKATARDRGWSIMIVGGRTNDPPMPSWSGTVTP